jgi:hypothetical protein
MTFNFNHDLILFVLMALLAIKVDCQSLSILNSVITWRNIGTRTVFNATVSASGSSFWLGVGINTQPVMVSYRNFYIHANKLTIVTFFLIKKGGTNVVVCYSDASSGNVRSYLNVGFNSQLFSNTNPTLGLSDTSISLSGGRLSCNFARDNSNSLNGYLNVNQNSNYYLVVAYGSGILHNVQSN